MSENLGPLPNPNQTTHSYWVVPATLTQPDRHYRRAGLPGSLYWYLIPRPVIQGADPLLTNDGRLVTFDEIEQARHWTTEDF